FFSHYSCNQTIPVLHHQEDLAAAAAAEAIAGESVRLRVWKEMGVELRNVSSHCSVERQRSFDGDELDGGAVEAGGG
ncbi:hypothetical protein CFP56_030352, partial [Quercus suber]